MRRVGSASPAVSGTSSSSGSALQKYQIRLQGPDGALAAVPRIHFAGLKLARNVVEGRLRSREAGG